MKGLWNKERWKKGLETAREVAESARELADKASQELDSGYKLVREKVEGLAIFMSVENSSEAQEYDEKHYFVIPFAMSEYGFALHTMLSLPDGVAEVNDLPKRRIFHFPSTDTEPQLRAYMRKSARHIVESRVDEDSNTLESLANDIDALDKKLTYGMLLVGGLSAIANPLLGAGIAAKAVLPSVAGLATKYGLRPAGEKLKEYQKNNSIKEAEAHVEQEFQSANTVKVINPILQELELILSDISHDPLTDPNLANGSIPELEEAIWRPLTEKAVSHVYQEVLQSPKLYGQARLTKPDIQWLSLLCNGHNRETP